MKNRCCLIIIFWVSLLTVTYGQNIKMPKSKLPGFDILIYGNGPAAMAAALASQRHGLQVAICFPEKKILFENFNRDLLLMQDAESGLLKEWKDSLISVIGVPSKVPGRQKDSILIEKRFQKKILSLIHSAGITLFPQSTIDTFPDIQNEGRFRFMPATIMSLKNKKKRRVIGIGYFIDTSPGGFLAGKLSCRFWRKDLGIDNHSGMNRSAIKGKFLVSNSNFKSGFPGQSIGFMTYKDKSRFTLPLGTMVPDSPIRLICPGPIFLEGLEELWINNFQGQILLGQAAAYIALVGFRKRCFVNQIPFSEVQELLIKNHVALVDFQPSISPEDSLFFPIQKLASLEWIPQKLGDLQQPFSEEEIMEISCKSGFSKSELIDVVGSEPKRVAIPLFWRFLEKTGKGP